MSESNKDRRFRNPTWGEVTCPAGPIWQTNAMSAWDRENRPETGRLPPLPFTLDVRSSTGLDRHPIFGGYCDGRLLRVMYRFYEGGTSGAADAVATLGPQDTFIAYDSLPDAYLRIEDWQRFGQLRVGSFFKIKSRLWAKLAVKDLGKVLKNRIFDVASCLAKPYPAGVTAGPNEEIYVAKNYPPRPRKPAVRFIRFPVEP